MIDFSVSASCIYTALSVTLQATSHTVSENDKTVEVCVAVSGINSVCPSAVPYQFTLTTIDKTGKQDTLLAM